MPHYAWICHSCQATNPAGAEACSACSCPAVASVADIEAARTGVKPAPSLSRKQWQAERRADIAALPFWKKPAAYALRLLSFLGAFCALSGIFDLSMSTFLTGLGIVLVAEVLFSLLKGRA